MNTRVINYKIFFIFLAMPFFLISSFYSCQNDGQYKTYILNEGTIHFSSEYPSDYIIDYYQAAAATGNNSEREANIFFKGPNNRHVNDYTYISAGTMIPDDLTPNAKSSIERVERNASTWDVYELYNKCEISIDGISGYRIDYQIIDVAPAIAGSEPSTMVYRYVYFDAKDLVWCIYINSPSAFAESDKIHFEHLLETFKILN